MAPQRRRSTKTNSDTRTISFYAGTASGYGSQSSQSYATTTQGWSNTYTSTKTSTAVITGTDGVLSPQPIIVIETPTKQTSSTQYTQWTGSYETTYTTKITTFTGSDGIGTTETI